MQKMKFMWLFLKANNKETLGHYQWRLSDCSVTQTHSHLVCKRILSHLVNLGNHLAKPFSYLYFRFCWFDHSNSLRVQIHCKHVCHEKNIQIQAWRLEIFRFTPILTMLVMIRRKSLGNKGEKGRFHGRFQWHYIKWYCQRLLLAGLVKLIMHSNIWPWI